MTRVATAERYRDIAVRAVARRALQKPAELAPFLRLVAKERPKVVVEIGTCHGGTFGALIEVAHPEALLVSVDLPGGPFGGGHDELRQAEIASWARPGQTVEFVRGDSHDPAVRSAVARILHRYGDCACEHGPGPLASPDADRCGKCGRTNMQIAESARCVDLLFIDGDHTYDGCLADFNDYSPFVATGGLIAFHDIITHRAAANCHVDRVWATVKDSAGVHAYVTGPECWEFTQPENLAQWGPWGGIGVIRYG